MSSHSDIFSQFGQNSGYVEELYTLFLSDPSLVGDHWARYFSSLGLGNGRGTGVAPKTNGTHAAIPSAVDFQSQAKVIDLIDSYRRYGHFGAAINPLSKGIRVLPSPQELDIARYGFSESDMEREFLCLGFAGQEKMRLRDLVSNLKQVYCGSVGFEFSHLGNSEERSWLRERIESRLVSGINFSREEKLRMLDRLIEAEGFEAELHKAFVGSKRFSLQGAETAIPMLDIMLQRSASLGVEDVVIGMAHRGRLNVLAHTVGKPYSDIFAEFEDQSVFSVVGAGDVKYHLGYRGSIMTPQGRVNVELCPNPSHLEFVNPVVQGIVRARQDMHYREHRTRALPVLIHGDAAFIGQGVVWETLNMSNVSGYTTAGTYHLVINNQVGFTTNPDDARSSPYCTDMAKAIQAPVFHVNCEDVEACCWVSALAFEFRQKFGRDVIIDLVCYRKYGHNEGDDPSFTQPILYSEITQKKSIPTIYGEILTQEGVQSADEFSSKLEAYTKRFQAAREKKVSGLGEACAVHGRLRIPTPQTGVDEGTLKGIAQTLLEYPAGFEPHPKLLKILEKRVETLEAGKGIDWGFAEGLAFGSLVLDGHSVRLSGQDCGRGTFSQRHLAISNTAEAARYTPFSKLQSKDGSRFEVFNSTLSEASVLGFEFGYSAEDRNSLICWEAQFGDFANGAQVIIDQFIAGSEAKWGQLSGVTLLLPHGFEGQGPEHSSARLERFLQLCGEGNMVVAYPSKAAQHFHLVRRQGLMEMKRPLVVMTPKSLLRLPQAAAELGELTSGQFETVLEDTFGDQKVDSVVFCSGKVFYDLRAALENGKGFGVKVLRIEQLYPFPQYEVKKAIKDLKIKTAIWAQEEPQNMGAWQYMEPYLRDRLELDVQYVGREVAASPATGSGKRSANEQQAIVKEVIRLIS